VERLVDRYLRDEALAQMPSHTNQHAYQAGKLMETALHQLVVRVEKAPDQQETVLGVFLDMEGAFNDTCYCTTCNALVRHGNDCTIVRWIRATWLRRPSIVLLEWLRYPEDARGEGVLSPLLWSFVVDDLITRLSVTGIYIQGYADDICILAVGRVPNTESGLMQWALLTVETW